MKYVKPIKLDKIKIQEIVDFIKSKSYPFGCSESMIRDEERVDFLNRVLKNRVTELEILTFLDNDMGCPSNYNFEKDCTYDEITGLANQTCAKCWFDILNSDNK